MRIEKRRRLYYAVMSIPRPLRRTVGKDRYVQSLGTDDRATAERHAALLQHQWLTQLEKARKGTTDHLTKDAAFWRRLLKDAPDDTQRDLLKDLLADEAQARVERAATRLGIVDTKDPRYDELAELAEQQRFVDMAVGRLLPTDDHLEDWRGTLLRDEPKTVAHKLMVVKEFAKAFPFAQDVSRKGVQQWVNKLSAEGLAPSTLTRKLQKVRGYWTYLVSLQAVPEASALAFEKLTMPRGSAPRGSNGRPVREAFTATEVVQLLTMGEQRQDQQLADLIRLGMYTGARIEELCSLKVEDVHGDHFEIVDAKSPAGRRAVPIHSQLKPALDRLVAAARARPGDPYIVGGQQGDQYNNRSGAVGKRASRLIRAAGHGPERVFHSIRKTVATLLENAGVPEGVAADILGHEKKTLSYGLYSSGSSMERKREAIEKLVYPDASQQPSNRR